MFDADSAVTLTASSWCLIMLTFLVRLEGADKRLVSDGMDFVADLAWRGIAEAHSLIIALDLFFCEMSLRVQ